MSNESTPGAFTLKTVLIGGFLGSLLMYVCAGCPESDYESARKRNIEWEARERLEQQQMERERRIREAEIIGEMERQRQRGQ